MHPSGSPPLLFTLQMFPARGQTFMSSLIQFNVCTCCTASRRNLFSRTQESKKKKKNYREWRSKQMLNTISEIMLACFKSNTYIILCNTIIIVVEAIENSVE